ncbi:MAG: aldo/keto reductase [Anaerolineaceae bacterium]|nr:aldo/keto reductase [Anaerolineaceae bacterium]MBN2678547.1 aldo/keto reductase [Anaerolineaceae bacterium]
MMTSFKSSKSPYDLHQVQLGIGTWSWGDRLIWQYGKEYNDDDVHAVFTECLNIGISFFDTAEVYGSGESERLIGRFLKGSKQAVFIATKFMPYPWRLTRASFRKAFYNSLKRLGLPKVTLYQLHWPNPPVPFTIWLEELARLKEEGLIEAIGVSNFNLSQTESAFRSLEKYGLSLASNQVEYHLLNRSIERSGLMDYCHEKSIRIIAYSPLAQGLLTGKYTSENPPGGIRSARYRNQLHTITPLISLLRKLGDQHGGKTPASIALNWAICKGTLPIPGVKIISQLNQNASALGWKLSDEEVALLDSVSEV